MAEAEERIQKLKEQVSDSRRLDKCGMQAALSSKEQHNRDLEESLGKAAIQRDELWGQILDLKEALSSAQTAQKESEARADSLQATLAERKAALQEALDSEVEKRNVAEHKAEQMQIQLGEVKKRLQKTEEELEQAQRELAEARRSVRRVEDELDREQSRAARCAPRPVCPRDEQCPVLTERAAVPGMRERPGRESTSCAQQWRESDPSRREGERRKRGASEKTKSGERGRSERRGWRRTNSTSSW